MERLLLWLDEIDDWLTMWAYSPARIRRTSLQAGLSSALALPLIDAVARAGLVATALTTLAAASILIWTAAAAAELVRRRSGERSRQTA